MNWEALGAVGDIVGAVGVIVTLLYLAVQLRQNTRAARSSTIQQISAQMGQNVENVTNNGELAEIFLKATTGAAELSATERVRFHGLLLMSFRRLESVFVQYSLGSIEWELVEGFEKSFYPLLLTPAGKSWWENARGAYHKAFVAHVEQKLASEEFADHPPNMLAQTNEAPPSKSLETDA